MSHPKLDKIIAKMQEGSDFKLTRSQYQNITGTDIPKNKSYTEKKSAVAKKAKEHGFKISVIPETLYFEKCKKEKIT